MGEPRPLNQAQKQAIQSLELALRRCQKVGVALCGMDDQLIAYRADDFDRLADEGLASYDVQLRLRDQYDQTIDDHGAYRDSGGW